MVLVWNLLENMPLPAINLINNDLALKRVLSDFGQDHGPNHPVNTASSDYTKSDDTMKVVRQSFVNAVAITGWHKWRNDKVDIAEEEKNGNRQSGLDRWVPVVLLFVEIEPGQTRCYEDVDDGERVRDDAYMG